MLVLLFAMTGSVVVPIKAVVANLVSLGATFGVMTAVFGNGFASGLLGTVDRRRAQPVRHRGDLRVRLRPVDGLRGVPAGPDQGVRRRRRATPTTAVRRGLQHTGRIITSAALLMVDRVRLLRGGRTGNVEQIGLGLAVAVADRRDPRPLPAGTGDDDPARPVELVGPGSAAPPARNASACANTPCPRSARPPARPSPARAAGPCSPPSPPASNPRWPAARCARPPPTPLPRRLGHPPIGEPHRPTGSLGHRPRILGH